MPVVRNGQQYSPRNPSSAGVDTRSRQWQQFQQQPLFPNFYIYYFLIPLKAPQKVSSVYFCLLRFTHAEGPLRSSVPLSLITANRTTNCRQVFLSASLSFLTSRSDYLFFFYTAPWSGLRGAGPAQLRVVPKCVVVAAATRSQIKRKLTTIRSQLPFLNTV